MARLRIGTGFLKIGNGYLSIGPAGIETSGFEDFELDPNVDSDPYVYSVTNEYADPAVVFICIFGNFFPNGTDPRLPIVTTDSPWMLVHPGMGLHTFFNTEGCIVYPVSIAGLATGALTITDWDRGNIVWISFYVTRRVDLLNPIVQHAFSWGNPEEPAISTGGGSLNPVSEMPLVPLLGPLESPLNTVLTIGWSSYSDEVGFVPGWFVPDGAAGASNLIPGANIFPFAYYKQGENNPIWVGTSAGNSGCIAMELRRA